MDSHNGRVAASSGEDAAILKVFAHIRQETGIDLRYYKPPTIRRRILRRMAALHLTSIEKYVTYLKKDASETALLSQDVMIRVTGFFRDPEVFRSLKEKTFPAFLKNRPAGKPVRIWVPGCCTGEEVYSLAMTLLESAPQKELQIQIFGTDVSATALDRARAGVYSEKAVKGVPRKTLERFFVKTAHGWQIQKSVRNMCTFAKQDLTQDPPFSKLDLISCRNVLIYLGADLQNKIFPVFHYALNPGGYLLMGKSETIGTFFPELFATIDKRCNVYAKKSAGSKPSMSFHYTPVDPKKHSGVDTKRPLEPSELDLQREIDRMIVSHYSPAAVLVSESLEVVQTRGDIAKYLRLPAGKASLNLLKMAREGLSVELRFAMKKARAKLEPYHKRGIEIRDGRRSRLVDIEILPVYRVILKERYFLVVFEEARIPVPPAGRLPKRAGDARQIAALRQEVSSGKAYIQSMLEEHETAAQELRSANEEILSSNEELQSLNEELETAKEELESTNEELTTVNEELESRNAELKTSNEKLKESRNSLNEAQRLAKIGSWSWDLASNRVEWSDEMFRIYGLQPGDPVNFEMFLAAIHPEDKAEVKDAIVNATGRGTEFSFEHRIVRPDGEIRLLHGRGQPARDAKGKVLRYHGTGQDISEFKIMQEALRLSEERFRLLIESVEDYAIYMMDPAGCVSTWNAGAERLKGYKAKEIIGSFYSRFFSEEDRRAGKPARILEQAVREGRFVDEGWCLKKDGTKFWAYSVISAVHDKGGRLAGFSKVTRDMTEQKRASQILEDKVSARTAELELANKELNDFFENATVGLHWVGPDGKVIRVNRAELELLGYTREEYVGHHIAEFHADPPVIDDILTRLARGEKLNSYEARLKAKDGSIRNVLISSDVYWEEGRFIHTRCFTRDVTEKVAALKSIEESERRKRTLLNNAIDGVISIDGQGRVVDWNHAAVQIFGYAAEEAIGKEMASLIIPPEFRDLHRQGLVKWRQTGEGPIFGQRLELKGLRHSGEVFPLELTVTPVGSRETPLFTAFVRDISERKLAEKRLRESAESLAASNRELEQFAYVASHDLQEPLRKIMAFSDRLKEKNIEGIGETERDYFNRMQSAAMRMKTLIEDLLNYSRVTTKESPLEAVPLNEAVKDALSNLEARMTQAKAVVEVSQLPTVMANPLQMQQLFQNLVGNSIKFARKDQAPRIRIFEAPSPSPDKIEIRVEDDGIGFDEKYLDRIFKPFQRLHGRGEYEGTGIGLAICQKIIQRHGGQLTAISRPGEGATFVITLPKGPLKT